MQFLDFYRTELGCISEDAVFEHLIQNLKPNILLWSYFVNWDKVVKNTQKIEVALNCLNYLIGKSDFDAAFRYLLKENPNIAAVIPALVVRDGKNSANLQILVSYQDKKLMYENYDFTKKTLNDADIDRFLEFVKKTGLKKLLVSQRIKNLVDYMIGVEAGLDSNARKNRGGDSMEAVATFFIADLCKRKNYQYLVEANAAKIHAEWGIDVPVDKSSRRYDFVVNTGQNLLIVETNFYGGGGSKLKSTANEYQKLFDVLGNKFKFLWITDGHGWKATQRPLREAFNHIDHIVSLDMLENGILESLLQNHPS